MLPKYAQTIPDLVIDGKPAPYPVVNERAVRATAGIMFAAGFATLLYVQLTGSLAPMYVVLPLFWLDFAIKVFLTPAWSPIGFVGRLLVSRQRPEWVGAIQKRFAWALGLCMASTVMFLVFALGVRGILPVTLCSLCLLFMWLESAVGYCVGCRIYAVLLSRGLVAATEHPPACPGGACPIRPRS